MIFGLLGARLVHVISDFHLYKNNLIGIFQIWNGGLAFHGGLLAIIFGYYYCKKYKIDMLKLMDLVFLYLPLIVAFGRIANFMNSEFYGAETNAVWCVVYQKIDMLCRHPTSLYQSLSQFLNFGILMLISKMKFIKKTGIISGFFMINYGVFRFFTDFLRLDYETLYFGLSHSQYSNLIMLIVGLYLVTRKEAKLGKS